MAAHDNNQLKKSGWFLCDVFQNNGKCSTLPYFSKPHANEKTLILSQPIIIRSFSRRTFMSTCASYKWNGFSTDRQSLSYCIHCRPAPKSIPYVRVIFFKESYRNLITALYISLALANIMCSSGIRPRSFKNYFPTSRFLQIWAYYKICCSLRTSPSLAKQWPWLCRYWNQNIDHMLLLRRLWECIVLFTNDYLHIGEYVFSLFWWIPPSYLMVW